MVIPVKPSTQDLWERWGAELRNRRGDRSQVEIARLSGVDQGKISLLERGKVGPLDSDKLALARVYGCEVAELFSFPSITEVEAAAS